MSTFLKFKISTLTSKFPTTPHHTVEEEEEEVVVVEERSL